MKKVWQKKVNSLGTITIPYTVRQALSINPNDLMDLEIINYRGNESLLLTKYKAIDTLLSEYEPIMKIISRMTNYPIALVDNSQVLAMTYNFKTDVFSDSEILVSKELEIELRGFADNVSVGAVNNAQKENVSFLRNGNGEAMAFYRIGRQNEHTYYFVIVKGTRFDKKVNAEPTNAEYEAIADIVKNINNIFSVNKESEENK